MTDCTISRSLRLLWLFATAALAAARSVDKRTVQTDATCGPNFSWADNQAGLSPCLLTAYVWGACFTGGWTVPALVPNMHYDNPSIANLTANVCTCSWAAYNLISACTECQNDDASVQTWAAYDQDCANYLSETYFPSNVTLTTGTTIPFWAGTNPSTWTNAKFTSAQAQAVANQHKPDLVPGQDNSGGKKPIGAIVGGAVGGAAVLAIGAAIVLWYIRKSKRQQQNRSSSAGSARPYIGRPFHNRSMSDISSKSILSPHAAMSVAHSQRPATMYTMGTMHTTQTMHTHTGSAHSLYSGMSPPGTATLSPQVHITPGPEEIIEPFNLAQRPTSPPITMTRKGSETTLSTTYTTQEAAGSSSGSAAGAAAGTAAAAALFMQTVPEDGEHHPPAYTPYASPTPSPEPPSPPASPTPVRMGHHPRYQKGSVDMHSSYDSTSSYGGHGDSISAVADVIQRMGLGAPPSPSVIDSAAGATTVATGESRNIGARPLKPNVTNPDS